MSRRPKLLPRNARPCPVPQLQPGQRAVYGLKPRTDPERGFASQAVEDLTVDDRPVAFVRARLHEYAYVLVFGWRAGVEAVDRRVDPDGYLIVSPVDRQDRARIRAQVRAQVGGDDPVQFW